MGLADWIDARLPYRRAVREHLTEYYAPKNFNFWYYFGSLAIFVLVIQIVSGVFLTMSYKPDAGSAFASVEYIMRDVSMGWFMRYVHSTGASMFFVVVYLHMFRALLYGSHRQPRELLWILGMLIFLCLMAEAFFGYLLPWGQTSYWGAQVIVNLFATVPYVGEWLSTLIRGDFAISDVTLNRFFALHVAAVPLVIIGLVFCTSSPCTRPAPTIPTASKSKTTKTRKPDARATGFLFIRITRSRMFSACRFF